MSYTKTQAEGKGMVSEIKMIRTAGANHGEKREGSAMLAEGVGGSRVSGSHRRKVNCDSQPRSLQRVL